MNSVDWLCSADAVRSRCTELYGAALSGDTPHFTIAPDRIDTCVDLVEAVTRENYPDAAVPYHSRWRHFELAGVDHWDRVCKANPQLHGAELARTAIDLVVVSVLLDAGAGPAWRYTSPSAGITLGRSEGLALASLEMFERGLFSSQADRPLQADARGLRNLSEAALAEGFQSTAQNPLLGLAGRREILQRLGETLGPGSGEDPPRVGELFDVFRERSEQDKLAASAILDEVLRRFVSVFPNAQRCGERLVGDVGTHTCVGGEGPTRGLVPLHKLSQWLSYSLVEPLEQVGLQVCEPDALTGLAEYRNGGLFIDTGVLVARDERLYDRPLDIYSEPVVEWRALTVALLDVVAQRMRERLRLSAAELPLAKVLQGGTWTAGRRAAFDRRADGSPPIRLASDGTVF